MKLIPERLTIVLAGSFNPAILTPQWVAKNALELEGDRTFKVEMVTPVAGIGGMPRFSFEGVAYLANFQNVSFFVGEKAAADRELAATVAARILEQLPHTPVSGIGFNFAFRTEGPLDELLPLFPASTSMLDVLPDDTEVVAHTWAKKLIWNGALVAIECEMTGGTVVIQFNVHHDVKSSKAAAAILSQEKVYDTHYHSWHGTTSVASCRRLTCRVCPA